ncbi:MAG TPA: hypothetical protein VFC19_45730 [Candidatus Limnocylindrales bacterium]|nr:hypothetical protein [Candidatus Limnocylindrales bacterium]
MVSRLVLPPVLVLVLAAVSGCGGGSTPPASADPSPSAASAVPNNDPAQPRAKLAARAAAAKDLRQAVSYAWKAGGRPDRTVSVQRAVDGSWRVDMQGAAHGGAVDIALVFTGGALHQCALSTGAERRTGCVRLDGPLPRTADPKVWHLFSDWLDLFTDRAQALEVSIVAPFSGAGGECFSIESSAVSMQSPLDAGIYCYERDGTLAAARMSAGTLLLIGQPASAPPALPLPGPVVAGAPLPLAAPPPPSAAPTPSH